MDQSADREQAAAALAAIGAQQERTRRAARMPWWVYAAMFVLIAGVTALNDFVDLSGAKVIAVVVLVLFVVVIVSRFAIRSAPLSWVRGVQPQRAFVPWVFFVVMVAGVAGAWLTVRYGLGFAHSVGGAIGLRGYPYTMMGILFGVVLTGVFALGHLLTRVSLGEH